jgi:hypothetical protein
LSVFRKLNHKHKELAFVGRRRIINIINGNLDAANSCFGACIFLGLTGGIKPAVKEM